MRIFRIRLWRNIHRCRFNHRFLSAVSTNDGAEIIKNSRGRSRAARQTNKKWHNSKLGKRYRYLQSLNRRLKRIKPRSVERTVEPLCRNTQVPSNFRKILERANTPRHQKYNQLFGQSVPFGGITDLINTLLLCISIVSTNLVTVLLGGPILSTETLFGRPNSSIKSKQMVSHYFGGWNGNSAINDEEWFFGGTTECIPCARKLGSTHKIPKSIRQNMSSSAC